MKTIDRHNTDHNRASTGHTNPHDHIIEWSADDGHPIFSKVIFYPDGNAPELKHYQGEKRMGKTIYIQDDGHMDFESISDFKRSLSWGMEAQFQWDGKTYGIAHDMPEDRIVVYEAKKPETERVYQTADEALEFMVGADRLRDIITKVHVVERTI